MTLDQLRGLIRDVPDFPKPGILFKDITPLLEHPAGFRETIARLAQGAEVFRAEHILAIESRGFIFGAALAHRLELPMHLVRKRGKLPRESVSIRYELEYGFDHLEVHADAIRPDQRYLIVDDLIATGGTAGATGSLVRQQGGYRRRLCVRHRAHVPCRTRGARRCAGLRFDRLLNFIEC